MTVFTLIDARSCHCGQIARALRHDHARLLIGLGRSIHHEISHCYNMSWYRKAWLIDGKLAALGGVMGGPLEPFGFLWLALAHATTAYPLAIAKEAGRQIDEIMTMKHELVTTVLGEDHAAQRLAIFLGFHVADDGPGEAAFSCAGRRRLARHLDTNPDIRKPIGNGYAIVMGYHREAA
jgi:hypothetical protein